MNIQINRNSETPIYLQIKKSIKKLIVSSMFSGKMGSVLHTLSRDEGGRTRENICNILSKENMYVNPRNIQLVSETNQALNYLMTLYLEEGDSVIVEEPIVPDNASVFRNKHLNIVTVPMEEDGMKVELLEKLIKQYNPKFIYTMPNYHNPTGITMSLDKRNRLLEIAREYDIPLMIHTGHPPFSLPWSVAQLADIYKDVKIVMIHRFIIRQ